MVIFNAICLHVEMCWESSGCHWDVERLFLSFQLSKIVSVATVKAASVVHVSAVFADRVNVTKYKDVRNSKYKENDTSGYITVQILRDSHP